jgi:hypothetical protein
VFSQLGSIAQSALDERGTEIGIGKPPAFYSQSEYSDFAVLQPRDVLGSSFATPLVAGLAALMGSRSQLSAYREVYWLDMLASALIPELGETWSDRRHGVVEALWAKAISMTPHLHLNERQPPVCPECAFFVLTAYVNFGLHKLFQGQLDDAELLLRTADAFAPATAEAAANLGIVYASRAAGAQQSGRWQDTSRLLRQAGRLQTKASALRPEFWPYRIRAAEFLAGAEDPEHWRMGLSPEHWRVGGT